MHCVILQHYGDAMRLKYIINYIVNERRFKNAIKKQFRFISECTFGIDFVTTMEVSMPKTNLPHLYWLLTKAVPEEEKLET